MIDEGGAVLEIPADLYVFGRVQQIGRGDFGRAGDQRKRAGLAAAAAQCNIGGDVDIFQCDAGLAVRAGIVRFWDVGHADFPARNDK